MSNNSTMPPWATGPGEILQHGVSLLDNDSDMNRRLAMISIDNSVELMMKTYLELPSRITGLKLKREAVEEFSQSFTKLLDAMECHVAEKIRGINLGEVEYYHRIRNSLYHRGSGLTVEREKVIAYSQIANILFENLFGMKPFVPQNKSAILFGKFMEAWVRIEQYETKGRLKPKRMPHPQDLINEYREMRHLRNQIVHGVIDPKEVVTVDIINRINALAEKLTKEE